LASISHPNYFALEWLAWFIEEPAGTKEFSILNDSRHTSAVFDRYSPASRHRYGLAGWAFIALIFLASTPGAPLAAPHIETDTAVATAGYYVLRWSAATTDVEVAEFANPGAGDPSIIYTGPDRATLISGQPDGTRIYRVREIGAGEPSAWSEPVSVTVAHHPLSRALTFFGIGAVVFLATLALIVRGARRSA
jgi:hypothetical protein